MGYCYISNNFENVYDVDGLVENLIETLKENKEKIKNSLTSNVISSKIIFNIFRDSHPTMNIITEYGTTKKMSNIFKRDFKEDDPF